MKIRPDQVIEFVTLSYLRDQKALTAKEIAKGLDCNETAVRRVLNEAWRQGLECSRGERASYSTDFPGIQAGYHRVAEWEPSKSHLVALIKSYQHALELEIDENNKRALAQANNNLGRFGGPLPNPSHVTR